MLKFGIVTPSYNQGSFIAHTISSVLSQRGNFSVDYVIQDGGSTDSTVNYVNQVLHSSSTSSEFNRINARLVREPDMGQYDAINKGFAQVEGDILAWINSDDLYTPWAFSVVAEIFAAHPKVEWIIGAPLLFNERGQCTNVPITKVFPSALIKKGLHINDGSRYARGWIGQDSVFWRRSLWDKVGGKLNINWDKAADYDLWLRFSRHANLVSVASPLAGFRIHGAQKTSDQNGYNAEAVAIHEEHGLSRITADESRLRKALSRVCQNGDAASLAIASEIGLVEYGDNIYYELGNRKWQLRKQFSI